MTRQPFSIATTLVLLGTLLGLAAPGFEQDGQPLYQTVYEQFWPTTLACPSS